MKTKFKTPKIMKTIPLMLLVGLLSITAVKASTYTLSTRLSDEALINDVPFNTGEIVNAIMKKVSQTKAMLTLKDEAEINDIPFNTAAIASKVHATNKLKSLKLSEESLVDDIPFDTHSIAERSIRWQLGDNAVLADEKFVDDIPFNTAEIASQYIKNSNLSLADESWIDDIPYDTKTIAENALIAQKESTSSNRINTPEISVSTIRTKDSDFQKVVISVTVNDNFQVVSIDRKNKNIQLILSN